MGSVSGLIEAISKLDQIDRVTCRQQLEAEYSLEVWGDRLEQWFNQLLQNKIKKAHDN